MQARELDEVAVGLLPEVEAVGVDDELDDAVRQPEVEHAHARDVARVGERLEGGVEQAHRVALGVAELGDVLVGEEVLVHPLEPLRIA
jgi:hypothetical protein